MTARRLSADLRFIHLARRWNITPKVPPDNIFDYESSPFILYRTRNNDLSFSETSLSLWTQRTHLIFQSTARLANVPAPFSVIDVSRSGLEWLLIPLLRLPFYKTKVTPHTKRLSTWLKLLQRERVTGQFSTETTSQFYAILKRVYSRHSLL